MNTELIKVARKAAKAWSKSDAYGQASEIISMLCDELEKMEKPVSAPPTVKDVLLKTWARDTEAMAKKLIENDLEDGGYFFDSIETKSGIGYAVIYQVALDGEIAYLNSAAEVGK